MLTSTITTHKSSVHINMKYAGYEVFISTCHNMEQVMLIYEVLNFIQFFLITRKWLYTFIENAYIQ